VPGRSLVNHRATERVNAKVRPALKKGYEVSVINNQQIAIVIAVASTVRSLPSRSAISPKDLPDPQGFEHDLASDWR
jgi:hypothetical protein